MNLTRRAPRKIDGHFTEKLTKVQNDDAINGWGSRRTPSLLTNRSEDAIQFQTLTVPGRGVTVHPSPTHDSVVAWRCPRDMQVRIRGQVADSDDQCGNGVAWQVQWQSASGSSLLAQGIFDNGGKKPFQTDEAVSLQAGDVVSLIVAARDGNHYCDTTHIELHLAEVEGRQQTWDLAVDVVDRVLEGNPLADRYGNADVWHFCSRGEQPAEKEPILPPDCSLAQWRAAVAEQRPEKEIRRWAQRAEKALTAADEQSLTEPDRWMRRRLRNWTGPLPWLAVGEAAFGEATPNSKRTFGFDPAQFGRSKDNRSKIDSADLCLPVPHRLLVRLPGELAAGALLVTSARATADANDCLLRVQLLLGEAQHAPTSSALPILMPQGGHGRQRAEAALDAFRQLFPPALCYARIVPVDEVVTLTLFHREDDHLQRLMLTEREAAELDRLWDELYFVSREPIELTTVYEQLAEFATQDRPDLVKALAPLQMPIHDRADAFRQRLVVAQPKQLEAVVELAERAWRRTLTPEEKEKLHGLYQELRKTELEHEQAVHLLIARVFASPAFLFRLEQVPQGQRARPVSDFELASRLSYFLWSSLPDDELWATARNGQLLGRTNRSHTAGRLPAPSEQLIGQTRRMLADPRTRRLAVHFACQWLHLRDFDQNDDKNERRFPEFAELRGPMYEETVRFFEDLFRSDRSILDILDADHTFLNGPLARHYGIDELQKTEPWRRVDGMRKRGRGGVLGMATFLASQSGASRTSPILRGNWVYETLLGERLPRPPANVPTLPEEVPANLTARQLIEHHSSVAACARCHTKIDPFGFALEQFDAIGRRRLQMNDTKAALADGTQLEGLDGLRDYLLTTRRDDFVEQFCRKLLGYALGREVRLTDEPLLDEMKQRLAANDYRFSAAVETIVASAQFRMIRSRSHPEN